VLAAGESRRLPGPKQLLRYRGATLLRHAAQTAVAAGVGPVVVVPGAGAGQLRFELSDLAVRIAENAGWKDGMSSSIRVGLDELEAIGTPDAALFTTCDQPLVTPALLGRLAAAFATTHPAAVACEYAGTVGVPALFGRSLFGQLRDLTGDEGAKRVIQIHLPDVVRVPFEDAALDIDTPEDAARLLNGGQ
jgi:molybdenum cofactor cytidylyltransferase